MLLSLQITESRYLVADVLFNELLGDTFASWGKSMRGCRIDSLCVGVRLRGCRQHMRCSKWLFFSTSTYVYILKYCKIKFWLLQHMAASNRDAFHQTARRKQYYLSLVCIICTTSGRTHVRPCDFLLQVTYPFSQVFKTFNRSRLTQINS